ncbi:uncharacterized protein LOC127880269 [Dreissena polymorpha]|uniref:Uncharacterized protein n=1 Tax=Dreissena polymorpha TaxID=45954 RepID=A0A9D4QHS7_DREPO|nr:uncharacterized protein LOC127880269 [Dreissena polymorpha]KAH3832498.1 hypothetical protein DPMN_105788 [Dreissena polymorpha]
MPRKNKRKVVFSSRKYRWKRQKIEISTDEEITPDFTLYIDTDEVPKFSSMFVQQFNHDHDYCLNDESFDIYAASLNMTDDQDKVQITGLSTLMRDPVHSQITGFMEDPVHAQITGLMEDPVHVQIKSLMEDPGPNFTVKMSLDNIEECHSELDNVHAQMTGLTDDLGPYITVKKTLESIEECDIQEVEVNNCVDFSHLQNEVVANISQEFMVYKARSKLILVQMYLNGDAVCVKHSIELNADFTCNIFVHRKPVPRSHSIWKNMPLLFDRDSSIMKLCKRILEYKICIGNPDKEFVELLPVGGGFINNFDKSVVAYREEDFNASFEDIVTYVYNSTIRSTSCELLIPKSKKIRCPKCAKYRWSIQKRKFRLENSMKSNRKYIHTNYKHSDMTKENILQKIQEQKDEIELLESELCKLSKEHSCLISTNVCET